MRHLAATIAFLLLTAAAAAGPIHVENGSVPARGVSTPELREQWRIGGENDEENFFGLVTWAELGPDGLVYVMDAQLCQVGVYDDTGALVRTLFRQGDGPGEVRQPRDLVLMPDGSVGIVQEFPGRIIRVDAHNVPLPTIEPRRGEAADGGFVAMISAEHRGGSFLISGVQIAPSENQAGQRRHMYLALVDESGHIGDPLVETFVEWDFADFTYDEVVNLPGFFWANAVGPDGRIYTAAERNAYRINVYAPDGTLERVIEREYTSRKRTAADRQWLRALLEGAFSGLPFDVNLELADTDADINWLSRGVQVDEAGNLWILSSRGHRDQPAGVLVTFDVFTPEGRFDRQVQIACPGDGEEDGVFLLGSDRLLVIKGHVDAVASMFGGGGVEEDDAEAVPMEIICYEILK